MIEISTRLNASILNQIKLKLSSYNSNGGLSILKNADMNIRNNRILKEALKEKNKPAQKNRRAQAAVLVPICYVNGIPSILFTLRSKSLPTHKGEISFPGGHVHENDESLEHTAIREMQEEIGCLFDYDTNISILGKTSSVPSLNGTIVTPIIAVIHKNLSFNDNDDGDGLTRYFSPDKKEVDKVFTRSIYDLAKSETSHQLKYNIVGPMFPGKEGNIWGLTAFILRPVLKHILIPIVYPDWRKGE